MTDAPSDPFDPFDPAQLRVDTMGDFEVEQVLTAVPVRKPKRIEFFRVHPEFVSDMLLVERDTGMDRESFLVTPDVRDMVASELRLVRLFTCINKNGTVFLWPVKLPQGDNDRIRRMTDTALRCADQAKTLWTKLVWNRDLGGYEMYKAKGDLGSPQWPDKTHRDLIEIAFRDNLIDRPDHPVIKELYGEI